MADPGVKAMIDGWADNTEYTATVTVKTGAGPQRNVAEVTSFQSDDDAEEEKPEEPEEPEGDMTESEHGKMMGKPKGKSPVPPIKYK